MGRAQVATFLLDGELFGVDVLQVQEVIRPQAMTPVPLSRPEVRGLVNLRGQIVTTLDLRRRLDLPDREDGGAEPMHVVVRTPDGPVSFLVDAVGDVLTVDEDDFERHPDTVPDPARTLLRGTYKLDGRLLLVLDTERALDLAG